MKLQFKVSVRNRIAAAQLVIDDDPSAFEALRADAEEIESQIDGEVTWYPVEESPENSNRSRVTVIRDADLEDQEQWSEIQGWLLERGTELHQTFSGKVSNLPL